MAEDYCLWFEQTKQRSIAVSEAYRIRLDRLWWANLLFVVFPAIFSATAAILAAKEQLIIPIFCYDIPIVSILAASAAILTTVHKSLKCEEYQTECLRLSQAYQSIAIVADAAIFGSPSEYVTQHELLSNELKKLAAEAKAQVSTNLYSASNTKG